MAPPIPESRVTELYEMDAENKRRLRDMINNMKRLAEKSEVAGLKELIEIYSPVKSQFITREEVENLLEEKIRRR